MATTPNGLPYPVGTDKVVDGDDAIQALATFLDPGYGPWTAYTPTFVGFTPGTSPVVGNWKRIGNTVHAYGRVLINDGFTFTGTLQMNLPAPIHPRYDNPMPIGIFTIYQGEGFNYLGQVVKGTSPATTGVPFVQMPTGVSGITGTLPNTWNPGQMFAWSLTYEGA